MRSSCLGLGVVLASVACGSSALALTQPDGTTIPTGSGLQTEFNRRGDTMINALTDAAILPETFVPACALTFQVLQRNADYNNSFGWYNVTGSAPALADLHEFLSCTDPVNTIRVLNIRTEPAYLGGEIGFYQATGGCGTIANHEAIFYSQRAFNPDGAGAGTYIHLLTYNSVATPRAFYFGWEDLLSGGDNDFDDLTTFVTGITCSGGGGACATGLLGICADGTMQCQNGALNCVQSNASTAESCNGRDDDCDGATDDGDALCPASQVCDRGECVERCGNGEFGCPPDKACNASGFCVDPTCVNVTCPDGERCVNGLCKGPCDDVTCPFGQVCRVGACVDPCDGITCDMEQICVAGACVDRCQCTGCADGQTCQSSGICAESACVDVVCPAGHHCAADGTCLNDCVGAACPPGEVCTNGSCVDVPPTATTTSGAGIGGDPFSGTGGTTNAGGGNGNGSGNGGADSSGVTPGTSSSCGCRLAGDDDDHTARSRALPLVGLLGLAAAARRAVRRQRRAA